MGVVFCYNYFIRKAPLTISELIEQLKKYPSDMRVVYPGYEGGYDDIDDFCETEIVINVNDSDSCYGVHEDVFWSDETKADEIALVLS